jgi:hypothetical protein
MSIATQSISIAPNQWTSLGAGPLRVYVPEATPSGPGDLSYAIADTEPGAPGAAFPLKHGHATDIPTGSGVWIYNSGQAAVTLVTAPILVSAGN